MRELGGKGKVPFATNTGVTVGSSSTVALALNHQRLEAIFVNDSDEVIYLFRGTPAVLNQGIRLNASGGSYIEDVYLGAFTAICASGSKVLTVSETEAETI